MVKKRMTGEVIYIRVPEGTRGRRDDLRGRERASDYDRRLYLGALDRAEASAKPSTKRNPQRSSAAKARRAIDDTNEGGNE